MKKFHLLFCFLFLCAGGYPSASWAKAKKRKLTPTPTPTQMATETPTPTPTSTSLISTEKIYTFDSLLGSRGSNPDQLNAPEAISVSDEGKIFIADTGNNRVLVWDNNGKPLQSFGSFGTLATWRNPPQFDHPSGILVLPSKKIFVADTLNHRVVALDEKGLVISSWGSQGTDNGQFNLPRSISSDHYGHLWILDHGNSRVEIFSQLGAYVSGWGAFGSDPGFLNLPLGMALNNIDQAVMADTGNFRLQVFNDKGSPVTAQGWFGEGPYQFKEPVGVVVTKTGLIAITDGLTGRVEFFNNRFEFIGQWRAKDEILNKDFTPHFRGIASDDENRLYITDMQDNVIVRLKLLKPLPTPTEPKSLPTTAPDANPYGGNGYPIR